MRYFWLMRILFFVILFSACGGTEENEIINKKKPESIILKDKASFNIGVAVKTSLLADAYKNIVQTHFSQITAEYEMKMEVIWTGENSYNFSNGDALAEFAQTNDKQIHGHALLWYKSFPVWFKDENYDSAGFENRIKTYIETVVSHYKGKVISWDVANEIFLDDGTLRSVNCPVFKTFKDPVGFYGRCFRYAHKADPTVKLFYNDYSVVVAPGKRNAMKSMVSRFKKEGYPIDGLGDQFHYGVDLSKEKVKDGLNDMASTGLLIHISELDIKVNLNKSDNYVFSPTEQQLQADVYQSIVESFESLPQDQKFAITTWGVTDRATWLTGWWHEKEYPLLFDRDYNAKPAYNGFLKGLK